MDDEMSASPDRRWLAGLRWAVSAAGVAALTTHVYWVWTGQFHSQDGPAHMFAISALGRLLGGDAGAIAEVYTTNLALDPNWITYPVLALGLRAGSPRMAELVLVTLLIVGLAAALHYALTARGSGTGPVAVAGFAVAVGWSLHTGLYNFSASLALLLVIVGYHIRTVDRLNVRHATVLAVLAVLLYFSHPMSLLAGYLTLGVTGLATTIADVRAHRSWRLPMARLGGTLAAVTPSAVLLWLWFVAGPGTVVPRATPRSVWESFVGTALFRWPIQAVTQGDVGWATGLAWSTWVVVVALLVRRSVRRDWNRWDLLLVLPLVMGAGAVLLPDRLAGGTLVQPRLAIYALLTLLLWIAVANADAELAHWLAVGLGVVGVVVLVGLIAVRGGTYREIHAAIEEVRSVAGAVGSDRTMLGAVSSRAPTMSPAVPLVHVTDVVARQAGAVVVSTLDAGSGYGPIQYRDRFDPGPALRGFPRNRTQDLDQTPEQFFNVVRQYARVTGRPFDYILLVAYDLRPAQIQEYEDMGFQLVRRTEPAGLTHLFEVTPRVLSTSAATGPAPATTDGAGRRRRSAALRWREAPKPAAVTGRQR